MERNTGDARVVHTAIQAPRDGFRFGNRFVYTWRWLWRGKVRRYAYGLCGGMCLAALDYARAGLPTPEQRETPPWGTRLQRYLLRRQWDSWRYSWAALRTLYWMALSERQVIRRTLGGELPRLLAGLEAGQAQVLLLLRATGLDPTRNHQVLATGYRREGEGGRIALALYDPNHAGREVALWVDPGGATAHSVTQSTGEPLQGFFVIRYRPRTPPILGDESTF